MSRKLPSKCNRCVPGHRCTIYVRDTSYVQVYCAICRRPMTALDVMRPRLAAVGASATRAKGGAR
jgi:hypothetical protein